MECLPPKSVITTDLHIHYEFDERKDIMNDLSIITYYMVTGKSDGKIYVLNFQKKILEQDSENSKQINADLTKSTNSQLTVGQHIRDKLNLSTYIILPVKSYKLVSKKETNIVTAYEYIKDSYALQDINSKINPNIVLDNMYTLYTVVKILHKNGVAHNNIDPTSIAYDKESKRFMLSIGLSCGVHCKPRNTGYCNKLGNTAYIHKSLKDIKHSSLTVDQRFKQDIYALLLTYINSFKKINNNDLKDILHDLKQQIDAKNVEDINLTEVDAILIKFASNKAIIEAIYLYLNNVNISANILDKILILL